MHRHGPSSSVRVCICVIGANSASDMSRTRWDRPPAQMNVLGLGRGGPHAHVAEDLGEAVVDRLALTQRVPHALVVDLFVAGSSDVRGCAVVVLGLIGLIVRFVLANAATLARAQRAFNVRKAAPPRLVPPRRATAVAD